MTQAATTAETLTHYAWETGNILAQEGGSIFIDICEIAVLALCIEIARLWHPDPESVARQHMQNRRWR